MQLNKIYQTIPYSICLLCISLAPLCTAAQSKPPNIIVFLVDDMGWNDCSVPFWTDSTESNKRFYTPNMEKLAAKGAKLVQAYAQSICTPTRVSLLTGMSPARHRVTNWTYIKNQPTDAKDDKLLAPPPWNVNGLSPTPAYENTVYATPLPELLKNKGYYTIMCGKAHFGADNTPGANPLNLGFIKNIGGSAAGNPASFYGEKNYGNTPGKYNIRGVPHLEKYWGTNTYLTEALTIEALKAIDTAAIRQQPFFLYMAHYAVHLPFDADPRFINRYKHLPAPEAAYATLVEGMDKSLGDIMQYLEDHNLEQNTILLFLSDNGGFSRKPRMGAMDTQNKPLRAGKGSLFEGGIRVPMLASWPGHIQPGTTLSTYTCVQDLYPTILQIAGIKNPSIVQTLDGKSIVPYLTGSKKKNRSELLWHFPNKWTLASATEPDEYVSFTSALRHKDWKVIWYYRTAQAALYNIKNDIGEQNNLAATNPAMVKKMVKRLRKNLIETHAQLPIDLATKQPVALPTYK